MKNNFEDFIEKNRELFDVQEPEAGHFERFKEKLEAVKPVQGKGRLISLLPWLMAAASVLLLITISFAAINGKKGSELADISPEMKETQGFFESTIVKEMASIQKIKTPENEKIIEDGLQQMNKLEVNYEILKQELKLSGQDKRVIYAMISNFQQRIEILQNIMLQLEELEEINKQKVKINNV
ncbi:MAG: DUF4179 domain-containing protein [Flavobacteriaceae bacterium]|nr:DUF4179 domain-containing protein [Flavobacteriaceae bacterium]